MQMKNERQSLYRAIQEHLEVLDTMMRPRQLPVDGQHVVDITTHLASTMQELRVCLKRDSDGIDRRNQALTLAAHLFGDMRLDDEGWRNGVEQFFIAIESFKQDRGY